MEEWSQVADFPEYLVSSYGQVLNFRTDRILDASVNQGGILYVNLFSNGRPYVRSVKVLVAFAFVPKTHPRFDTPIQLDGHALNVKADNLAWRTRAFAWKYTNQFREVSEVHSIGPLQDVDTRVMYRDIYDAATSNGLLFKDIWRCVHGLSERIPPTGQRILLMRHINAINELG